jgi:hypothetical protein
MNRACPAVEVFMLGSRERSNDHFSVCAILVGLRGRARSVHTIGGAGGIRTLDRPLQAYNGLANRRLQPLGHSSIKADMPDTGLSRKPQICVSVSERRARHPAGHAIKVCVPFVQHLPETSIAIAVFILRVQEASVILRTATEGGTRGRSRWFAGIPASMRERRGR